MSRNHEAARRLLDGRFEKMGPPALYARPLKGWIRAIRDALGMTTTQLAKRLGVPQSRVVAIEKGEVSGTLTLNTLYRAAEALECQVVYVLVPKQTLLSTIEARADKKAKDILAQTGHTMKLEDQETSAQELQAQYQRLVAKMLQGPPKNLWDDLE